MTQHIENELRVSVATRGDGDGFIYGIRDAKYRMLLKLWHHDGRVIADLRPEDKKEL